MVSLYMNPWVVTVLNLYFVIPSTLSVHMMKSEYSIAVTDNPGHFGEIRSNTLLLLRFNVPGVMREESLAFIRRVILGGLYKASELIYRNL